MNFHSLAKTLVLGTVFSLSTWAANFSFTGTFTQDDNVQLINFNVGAPSNVTLRSWGYAGGVNAAGATIARGGFDTILALFDSTGAFINQNDDGGANVGADSVTGARFDTFLTAALGAGSYTVAVMQYDNFAIGPNLSNGFVRQGQGNFTPSLAGAACTVSQFCDVTGSAPGNIRTGNWAFDVLNVEAAAETPRVPEPSSIALFLTGAAAIFFRRKRA